MSAKKRSTFYVLDFDRTLFDTIRGAEILTDVTTAYDEKLGQALRVHTDALLKTKTTFSIHDFVRETAGDEAAAKIKQAFLKRAATEDLLLSGAKELLAFIAAQNARVGILTFGSPEGQAVKIKAAGLAALPYLITNEGKKGALLASWFHEGVFTLPDEYGGQAHELILVDDKILSFVGFPKEHTRGYWVRTPLDHAESAPDLPNVRETASLEEVIALERELTKP